MAPARRRWWLQLNTEWTRIFASAFFALVLQRLLKRLEKMWHQRSHRLHFESHVELDDVQACLLSSVNLALCGRVEKRTVLVRPLNQIFTNEYVRNMVQEAAQMTTDENPFVCSYMPMEHRWHVLVAALNQLSSMFAPYHLFANHGSSSDSQMSNYESSWFVFTLVGTRTNGAGRFFITPRHRLDKKDDTGTLRIRILIANEQEMRGICSGDIPEPIEGTIFSERHRMRWELLKRFGETFEKQLARVAGLRDGPLDIRNQSWGSNLCGTLKRQQLEIESASREDESTMDYNNFLRMHIPVPLVKEKLLQGISDAVLFE